MLRKFKIISLILLSYLSICSAQTTSIFVKKAYLGNGIWQDSTTIKIENGIIKEISSYDSIPKFGNFLDLSTMTVLPGLVFPLENIYLDSSFNTVKFIEIDKINYDWSKKINDFKLGICTYLYYSLNIKNQISTLEIYPKSNISTLPIGIIGNNFDQFMILKLYNSVRNYGEFLIYNYADAINTQHFVDYQMNNLLLKNLFEEIPIYLIINEKKQINNLVQRFCQFNINYIIAYELLDGIPDSSKHVISALLFKNVNEYVHYLNTTTDIERGKYIPILKNYAGWNFALITIKKQSDKEQFINAMTSIPAEYFRINKLYGEIKIGKKANMLFFSSNPFNNPKVIISEMINGKIIIE